MGSESAVSSHGEPLIRICEVKSVYDDTDGMRIKVRLTPEDNHIALDKDLPYAFPLLPKMLHVTPKVGECVLLILATQGDSEGNRFFVGPVISQPQMMGKDPYNFTAVSLLKGMNLLAPQVAPSTNPNVNGTLPKYDDIAFQGRKNSDVILGENELKIRCGFESTPNSPQPNNLFFNRLNPAYIQMKFFQTKLKSDNDEVGSVVNVVGDKINLLSHVSTTNFELADPDGPITDSVLMEILDKAHPLPYGDVLVEFLQIFMKVFLTHTHPFPMDPPVYDRTMEQFASYDMNTLLSKSVRCN